MYDTKSTTHMFFSTDQQHGHGHFHGLSHFETMHVTSHVLLPACCMHDKREHLRLDGRHA